MSIVVAIIPTMQSHFDSVNAEDLKWKLEESVDVTWQVYLAGEGVSMVLVEALKSNHTNTNYLNGWFSFTGCGGKTANDSWR
jgi:hypothetical protein